VIGRSSKENEQLNLCCKTLYSIFSFDVYAVCLGLDHVEMYGVPISTIVIIVILPTNLTSSETQRWRFGT
jgi:hypothetical protein